MPKYKLNMVVDAWQFDGTTQSGVAIEEATSGVVTLYRTMPGAPWGLRNLSDAHSVASPGDWVVSHEMDTFFVTDEKFKSLYVPVKDTKVKD
jgi:hypothetical protein